MTVKNRGDSNRPYFLPYCKTWLTKSSNLLRLTQTGQSVNHKQTGLMLHLDAPDALTGLMMRLDAPDALTGLMMRLDAPDALTGLMMHLDAPDALTGLMSKCTK